MLTLTAAPLTFTAFDWSVGLYADSDAVPVPLFAGVTLSDQVPVASSVVWSRKAVPLQVFTDAACDALGRISARVTAGQPVKVELPRSAETASPVVPGKLNVAVSPDVVMLTCCGVPLSAIVPVWLGAACPAVGAASTA